MLTALVALTALNAGAAAEHDVASGQEIIQRFVKVSGGREAYSNIRNRAIAARLDLPDHGMEGELIEIFAPPDYRRILVFDVYEPNVSGLYNGQPRRWVSSGQWEDVDGAAAADILRHGQLNPFLDWTSESGEATVIGQIAIGDDACDLVEIKPVEGSPLQAFFSKDTGLLRRIDDTESSLFRHYDDYRQKDGVLVPYDVQLVAGMFMFDLKIVALEHNVDFNEFIPDDLFQTIPQERVVEMLGLKKDGSLRD